LQDSEETNLLRYEILLFAVLSPGAERLQKSLRKRLFQQFEDPSFTEIRKNDQNPFKALFNSIQSLRSDYLLQQQILANLSTDWRAFDGFFAVFQN
jgi:hypothetical protein